MVWLFSKSQATALKRAVQDGDKDKVEALILQGVSVNTTYEHGLTLLHIAVQYGRSEVVLLLIQKGDADVNKPNSEGSPPLHLAARSGLCAMTQILIENGSDIHMKDKHENTALHHAAQTGHSEVAELLLRRGAIVNDRNITENMPLHYAAWKGGPSGAELVEILVQFHADVKAVGHKGMTALHHAAQRKEKQIVRILLHHGASLAAKNIYQKTPLDLAPEDLAKWLSTKIPTSSINKVVSLDDDEEEDEEGRTEGSSNEDDDAGNDVLSAIVRIKDDLVVSATVQMRDQAAEVEMLLNKIYLSQSNLTASMTALRNDRNLPGGIEKRDAAFEVQLEDATNLLEFLSHNVDDSGRQEMMMQRMQQSAARCDDVFDIDDNEEVNNVLEEASKSHRQVCETVDAYAASTELMASAARTGCSAAEMRKVVATMRVAAEEVIQAEGKLQACKNRVAMVGASLLASLASLKAKRALCESIIEEADLRPEKEGLVPKMKELRTSLNLAQDELGDAFNEYQKAQRHGVESGELSERVAAARKQVHQRQKLLEQHERRVAEASSRYYPELEVEDTVREWGGLLSKRDLNNYTNRVPLSTAFGNHAVQRATRGDGTLCVLKFFSPDKSGRLLREARVLQRLRHPCVAEVTCVFESTAPLGWVMEMPYYSGGDLSHHMERIRRQGMAAIRRVVLDVAQGLVFVHRNGIVHCDLKPANVFLDEKGNARLGDFDISKDVDTRAAAATMTCTTRVQGTRGYMAPEVEKGKKACFASDVYSLGLILYDMVAKKARPVHVSIPALANPPPPVEKMVPSELEALMKRMLYEVPVGRPTAEEVGLDPFFRNPESNDLSLQLVPPVHWRNSEAHGELVDVTRELGYVMQSQINRTCTVEALGRGRDNVGSAHKGLCVEAVMRVEHATLWKEYQFRRVQMQQNLQQTAIPVDPLCAVSEGLGTDPLSRMLNEVRIFHGTKHNFVDLIVSQGMDERVCKQGLYGAGLYFAENSSKSDEYMVPADDGLCDLLVCRALLGNAHVQKSRTRSYTHRRPPCVEGHISCTEGHRMSDSIIAEIPDKPREFVLFDRTSVFPEYVVRVRRVDVENPKCEVAPNPEEEDGTAAATATDDAATSSVTFPAV